MLKYTKKERKIIHKKFKEAKERLWDGVGENPENDLRFAPQTYSQFICYAIPRACFADYLLVRGVITDRLGGYFETVEDFLIKQKILTLEQVNGESPEIVKMIQDYRHRWLDSLIEEFAE